MLLPALTACATCTREGHGGLGVGGHRLSLLRPAPPHPQPSEPFLYPEEEGRLPGALSAAACGSGKRPGSPRAAWPAGVSWPSREASSGADTPDATATVQEAVSTLLSGSKEGRYTHAAGRNSEPRTGQADPAGAWTPAAEQELGGGRWAVGGGQGVAMIARGRLEPPYCTWNRCSLQLFT